VSAGSRPAFDLDAYLQRIGFSGEPTLDAVHRAHALSIPFENLDPHRGVPVSLEPGDVQRKLVRDRRGGYCFEQNLLLKAALEELGIPVEMYLARVRYGGDPGAVRPRGHLVLRARLDGQEWHADVGFGLGSPQRPLPWGPGDEHELGGWRYRVVEDRNELVLQCFEGDAWVDMYGFVPEAVPMIDVHTINWWVCTFPRSPFVTGLIVSRTLADGTYTAVSDWSGLTFTERTPQQTTVTPIDREQVPALLAERFDLPGFVLGEDQRLAQA
jgi:N-hydroxyarylamine O-acetyltransferase